MNTQRFSRGPVGLGNRGERSLDDGMCSPRCICLPTLRRLEPDKATMLQPLPALANGMGWQAAGHIGKRRDTRKAVRRFVVPQLAIDDSHHLAVG